jgi:uncharacterized cupin superfamily protein
MANPRAEYVVEHVDVEDYEPEIIDGSQVGESHQLEPQGESETDLDVSLWRSDRATYDYLFERDEANIVVAGAATVEIPETGERIELREGNVAYFRAGIRSIWTITEPFVKFVVMPHL